jgi:hypothetical protein
VSTLREPVVAMTVNYHRFNRQAGSVGRRIHELLASKGFKKNWNHADPERRKEFFELQQQIEELAAKAREHQRAYETAREARSRSLQDGTPAKWAHSELGEALRKRISRTRLWWLGQPLTGYIPRDTWERIVSARRAMALKELEARRLRKKTEFLTNNETRLANAPSSGMYYLELWASCPEHEVNLITYHEGTLQQMLPGYHNPAEYFCAYRPSSEAWVRLSHRGPTWGLNGSYEFHHSPTPISQRPVFPIANGSPWKRTTFAEVWSTESGLHLVHLPNGDWVAIQEGFSFSMSGETAKETIDRLCYEIWTSAEIRIRSYGLPDGLPDGVE